MFSAASGQDSGTWSSIAARGQETIQEMEASCLISNKVECVFEMERNDGMGGRSNHQYKSLSWSAIVPVRSGTTSSTSHRSWAVQCRSKFWITSAILNKHSSSNSVGRTISEGVNWHKGHPHCILWIVLVINYKSYGVLAPQLWSTWHLEWSLGFTN